jgi:hypothetical protein
MAKQDNPKAKTEEKIDTNTQPVDLAPEVKVAMAPLQPSVEQRLEALEQASKNEKRRTRPEPYKTLDLHTCNKRYHEVARQMRAEKRDSFEVAKKALETAFVGRRKAGPEQRRTIKDLTHHGAELRAQAALANKDGQ